MRYNYVKEPCYQYDLDPFSQNHRIFAFHIAFPVSGPLVFFLR